MKNVLRRRLAVLAAVGGLACLPAIAHIAPTTALADGGCAPGWYYDPYSNKCLVCDITTFDYPTGECGYWDNRNIYINPAPVIGPAGPIGVGGVVGPVGPGPVGPGPVGPGPAGPGPIGPGGPGRR